MALSSKLHITQNCYTVFLYSFFGVFAVATSNNILSIISSSAVFAATTFAALQYIQVTPLEKEVAVLESKLENQKERVVVSVEYRKLQDALSRESAQRELLESQLADKSSLNEEVVALRIQLKDASKKLQTYQSQNDYNDITRELSSTKQHLVSLNEKYEHLQVEYQNLSTYVSIRKDLEELKSKKHELTSILRCMNKANQCPLQYMTYMINDFDQASYDNFKSELNQVNGSINLILTKLPAI